MSQGHDPEKPPRRPPGRRPSLADEPAAAPKPAAKPALKPLPSPDPYAKARRAGAAGEGESSRAGRPARAPTRAGAADRPGSYRPASDRPASDRPASDRRGGERREGGKFGAERRDAGRREVAPRRDGDAPRARPARAVGERDERPRRSGPERDRPRPGASRPGSQRGPRSASERSDRARPAAAERHPARGAARDLPPADAGSGVQTRALAARVLDAVLHRGRSLKAELALSLPALRDPRDRALVEAICFAVLRQPLRYERTLEAWMPRPPSARDGELRALLYVGLAQLDPLRLPEHAALAATVEAARALGHPHQAGLVNALLRRAQRDGLPALDPTHSHWPSWLRGRLRRDWPQQYAEILAASALPPPMWLRVNAQRETAAAYLARLAEAGVEASAGPGEAVRLQHALPVAALPGFDDGLVSVQDLSAQQVADALAPPPGARVLDACAAPGGKSAHLLERDPQLRLTALDIDAARLRRVEDTLRRLGLSERAQLRAADAAEPAAWWDGQAFDAIVLDAPCSATGIVRRQPDVVLHRRETDLAALVAVQARLLDALWTTLAPGGCLLYATCSILHDENEGQVRAFLARTADARVEPLDARHGHDREVGRQRLPGEDGGDGFFYARLRRAG